MKTNCLLTVPHYGYARVRATQVAHGMDVIAYAQDGESRAGSTFYPAKRADSDFDLTMIFTSANRYSAINRWLQGYVDWAASPDNVASPMRVVVAKRSFDMTGVLKGGITFGRQVGSASYGMTLSFVGARSPIDLKAQSVSTYSKARAGGDKALVYFNPSGTQLKNSAYGWDYIYDSPSGTLLLNNDVSGTLDQVIPGLGTGVNG